jgi:hypothetical protein
MNQYILFALSRIRTADEMNQYILFALSRITTADEIAGQKVAFDSFLTRYPMKESEAALRRTLAQRH